MFKPICSLRFSSLSLALMMLLCVNQARAQKIDRLTEDSSLINQKIGKFALANEGFLVAVARLNSVTSDLGFAIELIQGTLTSGQPPDPKFNAEIQEATLAETLDFLCKLDPRYTWSQDETTINIYPRSTLNDPAYFFNRRVTVIEFHEVRNADDTLSKIVAPVSSPKETFLTWQSVRDYSKPWSAKFTDVTVREALNRVVRHLSPTEGWMVFGNPENLVFAIHDRITPRKQ